MSDDKVAISNHLTTRDGVYQYVRRVPQDLRSAFAFARVQKSLRTRDERKARAAAVDLDRTWDQHFAEARRRKGLAVDGHGPVLVETENWSWPDWQALATWFEASLAEEDWRARLASVKGGALSSTPDLAHLPWRASATVKEHIARREELREMTVARYAETRMAFVQGHVRRVGVALSKSSDQFERFMAACLAAELAYLDLFELREARRGGLNHSHPDTVQGPWRKSRIPESASLVRVIPELGTTVGKTLKDCRAKWVDNREKVRKQVRPEYLREMDNTIAAFEKKSGTSDIGQIGRQHVLAFRDHLSTSEKNYAIQTINKKVGFITSLMATALNAGWTDVALGPEIFLEVPEDEDSREPYTDGEITTIFSHPLFTTGFRFTQMKAGGELQFWLPLIACLHGMISSEILQLGPESVEPHPDFSDILCFNVTNAGDRRIKTLARRRRVPIRRELLDLGFVDVIEAARRAKSNWLWTAMQSQQGDVTRTSNYFSSFWGTFTRDELAIGREGTSLYSFRHAFQDALARAGYGDEIKKSLMGHAESGMTGRYGTKKQPRVVPIRELDEAVQNLDWPFLKRVIGQT